MQHTSSFALNETAIDHQRGDDYWGISTGEKKWINKLEKLAKDCPEDVQIIHRNDDGSIYAHVGLKFVKISQPRRVSQEQKDAFVERMKESVLNDTQKVKICL